MATTTLPTGYTIWTLRLNGTESRRPTYVLARDGKNIAQAYSRSTLIRKALAA